MSNRDYAFLLSFKEGGPSASPVHTISATVVYPDPARGTLVFPTADGTPRDVGLTDLVITSLIDTTQTMAWGYRHDYRCPYTVDLDRAVVMVRTLRSISRGLEHARTSQGDVESFADYLFRISAALRIRGGYYLPNSPRRQELTGEKYAKTGATGVQSWIREQEQRHARPAASDDS